MFRVGTGLDSQILGDFEIIAQIRNSFHSQNRWFSQCFYGKTGECCYPASKK
jgi:glutamyl-tRNA reductase